MDFLEIKELYHHGIKGQKWGIRRYQNEDGTLTEAGRERYGVDKKTGKMSKEGLALYKADNKNVEKGVKTQSAFKTQKIEKYINQGLTAEQANKRYKMRKTAAIGAAAVAAIVASYGTYKIASHYKDQNIKQGKHIQRISNEGEKYLNNTFYGAVNSYDKTRYKAFMPDHYEKSLKSKAVIKDIVTKENVKIASPNKAKKIYQELVSSGKLKESYKNYDEFNKALVYRKSDSEVFYNALKKLGYGGIVDVNDKKYSGFGAVNPIIFFGGADKFKVASVSSISNGDGAKLKRYGKVVVQDLLVDTTKYSVAGTAIVSGKLWLDSYDSNKLNKSNKKGGLIDVKR